MNHTYTYLALDLANERTREARDSRRAVMAASQTERPSIVRRGLAYGLAAVSRGSAAAAGRLDSVATDDFRRTLAHDK